MTQALPLPATAEPRPRRPVRIVTAASLFDGHDAAINVMRRIIQASGAEVIHLGHNRSVAEIVDCAIQEDARAIAITSYQGGHIEYFKYMHDLLAERGADIKIFGGGGGTILPQEIEELHRYGIARIYSPDDGRALGLQGMIDDLLRRCDFARAPRSTSMPPGPRLPARDPRRSGRLISLAENYPERVADLREGARGASRHRARPPSSASPAPAAPASRRWSTSWCAASSPTSPTRRSPSSPSTRPSARPAARCSATASA